MEKNKSTIFGLFDKIAKGTDKEKVTNSVMLVKLLTEQNEEDSKSIELNAALKRLICGVGSSREVTKKASYTTLTAYLATNPDTSVHKILEIVENELQDKNSNSKSTNAEVYTGRILTCGSLIRSNILQKCSSEEQQKVLELMISSGKKRSYLSFTAFSFVNDFLNQISQKIFINNIWPFLQQELIKPWSEQTLDTLHTLLIIQDKFPSVVNEIYKTTFGDENLINAESLESISKVLTEIPRINCFTHPVYKCFIEHLCETEHVLAFWTTIEKRYSKRSMSLEFVATEILRLLFETTKDKNLIPQILTKQYLQLMLMKCQSLKSIKKDGSVIAFKGILASLPEIISESVDKVKINTIKSLMLNSGNIMIEKMTGLKMIQLITASLSAEGVKKLSKTYKDVIDNVKRKEGDDDNEQSWTNLERIYIVQLFTKLLSHSTMTSDHAWRLKKLKYLFKLAHCESENIGGDLSSQIKVSFYRALDNKLPKLSDLRSLLSDLVSYLNEEICVNDTLKLRTPLEEAGIEAWKKMMNLAEKSEGKNDNFSAFFHTMDLHMGLQLFNDPEMAISSIDELSNCFERMRKKSRKSKSKDEDEPEWIEVVVDLILSLLSRNNHLLRSVVGCVFPHICPHLTSTSLHQILEVLDVKNTKGPLTAKGAEDDEDSSDSEAESDNEEDNNDNSKIEDEAESESDLEKDSELEDEEEEDGDETAIDRLRMAVSQALGGAAAQTDDEIDVDDIDEEEGKRLNQSLAAAFKILRENRQTQSKKQAKSAEILSHFRSRVIDLLEAYMDSCPPMALALDMVVPLFMLLEFCIKEPHQKPLENKVKGCLKKLSQLKKFKDTENVDNELLTTLMKVLIGKGERTASVSQEMGDQLAGCCMLLVRCSQQANLPLDDLISVYKDNLTAFFKKRDCTLSSSFFKNILQLHWEGNWTLVPLLVDFIFDSEIRSFRRSQAVDLLIVFYRNSRILQDEQHKDARLKFEKKLCKRSIKILQELSAKSEANEESLEDKTQVKKEIKQKFVGHLFTLLHAVRPRHLPEAWNWQNIAEAMVLYRQTATLSNDVKASFKKLSSQIGVPAVKQTKKNQEKNNGVQSLNGKDEIPAVELNSEKDSQDASLGVKKKNKKNKKDEVPDVDLVLDEDNEDSSLNIKKKTKKSQNDVSLVKPDSEEDNEDSSSNNKKKKKKNQNEKQRLKKEARKLRAEAMSEGLELMDFSSVNLTENGNHENEVEEEETEIRKEIKSPKHKRSSDGSNNRPNKKKRVSDSRT